MREEGGGRGTPRRPRRAWGALVVLGLARATRPLRRMWSSDDPLEDYALVHMASVAGDTLVGLALADSIFFSIPVDEAKTRVALYLALTMAPLAIAAPMLVPLLDRGGFRRALSFGSAAVRALVAIYAAPRVQSFVLFPAAFLILALSRAHAVTKNGLTAAYAESHEGLLRANAWLGRIAVVGPLLAIGPGLLLLKLGGATATLYLAAIVYGVTSMLVLRLERPDDIPTQGEATGLGRVPGLAVAGAGMTGLRAAAGFLLFLLAFALRRSPEPAYWLAVLMASAMIGTVVGDFVAPRLPRTLREETVVLASLVAAGGAALLAFSFFALPVLALFAALVGAATEFGRLAFQSLMQRSAPAGYHGRVFVRYEVAFQLAWVTGAFIPAMLPVSFRVGLLLLAAFYTLLGLTYLFRPELPSRLVRRTPK
ncbi:MAG: MFS transporter [Actinobacteria bacterium]|nr:MFS transporter [Actinomycetota bacterium]